MRRLLPVAIVLLVTPFVAAACDDDEPTVEEGTVTGDADDTIYDEEYGLYEPDEFDELDSAAALGRTVTVSANVKRIVEPDKAFITGAVNLDNDLLVVTTPKVKDAPGLSVGDDVLVVGKVIQFVSTDIETAYEPFDLDNDLYGDYDDDHAILAQTIIKPPAAGSGTQPGATTSSTAPASSSG
jgi:hypothetical protein